MVTLQTIAVNIYYYAIKNTFGVLTAGVNADSLAYLGTTSTLVNVPV